MTTIVGTNTGHGHVWARPDGAVARCGGPSLCGKCRDDQALMRRETARCTSCDHLMADHQPEGCRRAVIVGAVGKDLVCPCVVQG